MDFMAGTPEKYRLRQGILKVYAYTLLFVFYFFQFFSRMRIASFLFQRKKMRKMRKIIVNPSLSFVCDQYEQISVR